MPMPTLRPIDLATDRETLVALSLEYMGWVAEGIERHFGIPLNGLNPVPLADDVASAVDTLGAETPPQGIFYLLELDGQAAGMGGLRRLDDGTAEIKRFYIRPAHRGLKLGTLLLNRLLMDAQIFGYRCVMLDTAPFMQAAHALYESAGFRDCAAYAASEVPAPLRAGWRFMEKQLPHIRPAVAADANAAQACIHAAFSPYIERIGRPPAPMLLDLAQEVAAERVWIAEIGGALAGVIVQYMTDQGFYIDTVAVQPALRGTGVGRALLQFAEAEAGRRDCGEVYLCTNSRMVENQALYSRVGYTEYERKNVGPYDRVFYRKQVS